VRRLRRSPRASLGASLAIAILLATTIGPRLVPHDPLEPDYRDRFAPPSVDHWLGTDALGRDVFARALAGGRVSLVITGAATLLALSIGLLTGLAAAGAGGTLDVLLTRTFDALLAFPGFLLVLLLVAALGGGVAQTVAALGVAGSPLFFRLTRAFTRQELGRDYVAAGTALGAGRLRLLLRHVLPNFVGVLIVQAASTAAAFLLVEASLSYLGLGVPLPTPSWGNVLQDARAMLTRQPWAALGPGLVLAAATLAFQSLADGARDGLDRRS